VARLDRNVVFVDCYEHSARLQFKTRETTNGNAIRPLRPGSAGSVVIFDVKAVATDKRTNEC